MVKSIIEGVADFFKDCPLLNAGAFRVDALGDEPQEYTIETGMARLISFLLVCVILGLCSIGLRGISSGAQSFCAAIGTTSFTVSGSSASAVSVLLRIAR